MPPHDGESVSPRKTRRVPPINSRTAELQTATLCDNLPRVHDALRIERLLDRTHRDESRLTEFALEVFHLALSDAMFACARSVHGERPLHQSLAQPVCAVDLGFVCQIHEQREVEIAVANMAHDRCD